MGGMNQNATPDHKASRRPAMAATTLPQLTADDFLTDAGLETSLIFDDGLELIDFGAFALLDVPQGRSTLRRYYQHYLQIADDHGIGVVLETATWRASTDWVVQQGFTHGDVARLNEIAVRELIDLREEHSATSGTAVVISGCVGPRLDGYSPARHVSAAEAFDYHAAQVAALAGAGADLVSAITMTSPDEAIGITLACREVGIPSVVSFTVETDGRLPDGTALDHAIRLVDEATGGYPAYFMVNCAHPDHFREVLTGIERIRGLRCNASRLSHAELDEAEELDRGNPDELATQYAAIRQSSPQITIWGGCCGTNHDHILALASAVSDSRATSKIGAQR
jgi:S-methylmethionine-dependent homocysteine/selenocysteine methylase